MKNNELFQLIVAGFLTIFIISLPINNILVSFRFTLIYIFLMFLPFSLMVAKIKIGLIEKFILINLCGLSYAAIYVVLDVILKIPINKITILCITMLIYISSWIMYKK